MSPNSAVPKVENAKLTHSEGRRTFLAGRLSDQGFAHYFLATFVLMLSEAFAREALSDASRAR